MGVINAATTGMGLLTGRPVADWHTAPEAVRGGCRGAVKFCNEQGLDFVKLAIQVSINHPGIATTLVGGANPLKMARSVEHAESSIDYSAMAAVLEGLQPIHNHNYAGRSENRDPLYPVS